MRIKAGKYGVLRRLGQYMANYKLMLALAMILTVISNLLALVGPLLSGYAIDAIAPGEGKVIFDTVFFFCGLMVLFYLLSSVLSYGLSVLMISLSQKLTYKMRQDCFERLTTLPVGFTDKHAAGELISCFTYDIDTVNASLSQDFIQICTSFITVVGSLVMMIAISPVMMLIFVVTIPASIFFTRYKAGKVRPLFRERSAKLAQLNGYVEEIVSGQKTIKAYRQEKTMIGRFDTHNTEAVEAYYKADYYASMLGPSVNFINNISLSLVSVFGALLYLFGQLTVGDVSSFVLYSRKFSGPINEMANIISELQSAMAAAERVFRLLDAEPEAADAPDAVVFDRVKGAVRMDHVGFGYDPEKIIIHDLSMEASPGNLIAIVGPTGAGKTTLINLLMRFYDPQQGKILLDETDIAQGTRASLRLSYAMVLQDTWLFHGTVYENLAYGREDVTRQEVEAAAKAARVHSFIMRLPDGYDTMLGGDGVSISQGQRQMLTIARAMLLDSKMLILDEATSNVDTRTEMEIQEAMRRLMEGKTSFVVAHRLSTIQNADTILVVKDGDIIEQGNHKTLLAQNGFYAELYNSQFDQGA